MVNVKGEHVAEFVAAYHARRWDEEDRGLGCSMLLTIQCDGEGLHNFFPRYSFILFVRYKSNTSLTGSNGLKANPSQKIQDLERFVTFKLVSKSFFFTKSLT